jgi:hypothetical protein
MFPISRLEGPMPISLRFLFIARPVFEAFRLIRFEPGVQWYVQRPHDAQQAMLVRELSKRLPPHLKEDALRDE